MWKPSKPVPGLLTVVDFQGKKKHLQTNVGASTEFIMELIMG